MAGPFTITALGAGPEYEPRGHHIGLQHVTCSVSLTAALTTAILASATGLTLIMGKVPVGANIVAVQYNMGMAADNDCAWNIGYDSTLSAFAGGGSFTGQVGIAMATTGLPLLVSKSDDAAPRHINMKMTLVLPTSISAAGVISMTTFFTNDLS